MITSRASFPLLNNVFRRVNQRVSRASPIVVDASLGGPSINDTLKVDLHTNITDRLLGHGVPLAPYDIFLNGTELTSGRCDTKGYHVESLSLPTHRNKIDIYHGRRRLVAASDSLETIWDNFKGKTIDESVWTSMKSVGVSGGNTSLTQDEKIIFDCYHAGWGTGIRLNDPVDMAGGSVSVKLKSSGYTVCQIGILPVTRSVFMAPGTGEGYVIGLYELGVNKFHIYRGPGGPVLSKPGFVGNPETVKFTLDDDGVVHIFEENNEVFSELYPYDTTLCNIYLCGMSWYWLGGGTSWADNFVYVSG